MHTDRRRRFVLLSLVVLAALVTMASATLHSQAPRAVPLDDAPSELAPAIARAGEGMTALQSALQDALMEALASEGPVAAVHVCAREAYVLAAVTAEQQGIAIGRTSHALRNPKNAPRPWAAAIVAEGGSVPFARAHGWAVDLGDRVGVLQPIQTRDTCIICHGAPAALPPEITAALGERYPEDRATGFAAGQVRGWLWAEVPKAGR